MHQVLPEELCSLEGMGRPRHVATHGSTDDDQKNEKMFNSTLFPAILIGLDGHVLEISTVLTLERVVVNELVRFNMKHEFEQDDSLRKLMRIAVALKECKTGLEGEYKKVVRRDSSADVDRRCFPDPTFHPASPSRDMAAELELIYSSRLNRRNQSFRLSASPSPENPVVSKTKPI